MRALKVYRVSFHFSQLIVKCSELFTEYVAVEYCIL